jgi:hypothetical protein
MGIRICDVKPGTAFSLEERTWFRESDGAYIDDYHDRIDIHGEYGPDYPEIDGYFELTRIKVGELEDEVSVLYQGKVYRTEDMGDDTYNLTDVDGEYINLSQGTIVQYVSETSKPQNSGVSAMFDGFDTKDFFRSVDRCVYDFRSGRLGVKKTDGKGFSTFNPGANKSKPTLTVCELKEFGQALPAYAMRTPIKDLKPGDLVIIKDNDGTENWLYYLSTEVDGDTTNIEISGIETDTGKKVSLAVQDGMLLLGDAVLSVKNFLGDRESMKNMLLPLLLMGNKDSKNNNALLAMMMMNGEEGGECCQNMMLPLMMMNGGGGGNVDPLMVMMMMNPGGLGGGNLQSMLPLLLMSKGGSGDMNPLLLMMMMNGGKLPCGSQVSSASPKTTTPAAPAAQSAK